MAREDDIQGMADEKPKPKLKVKKGIPIAIYFARLRKQTGLFFWIALVVLIMLELLVLRRSATIMISIKNVDQPLEISQTVRVNFTAYDDISQRIDSASSYSPPPDINQNPFAASVTSPANLPPAP